jgi:UDP-N-acetylglucosamine diphosphorylase/glucosamine-1-phosphate N-acetyltransferase
MPIKTAIVPAAGEGTRLRPLTLTRSKHMIPVAGKPFIHHVLEQVAEAGIKKAVIVVGYRQDLIRNYLDANAKKIGLKIEYVDQGAPLGTGHAFAKAAESIDDERFIWLSGDNFYPAADLASFIKRGEEEGDCLVGAIEVDEPQKFGVLSVSGERVTSVVEKPERPQSNLANASLYLFDRSVLPLAKGLRKSPRGEYEITDILKILAGRNRLKFQKLSYWKDLGMPWDILDFNHKFLSEMKGEKIASGADVERGATIKGPISIGKGTVIKAGAYIEGPVWIGEDCEIGPNCYIREGTSLGNKTGIGNAVEVKNSVFLGKTNAKHLSYIADSVIGENCNLAAGTITANLRHDKANVRMFVRGLSIDSERRKLGLIMGDNSKTGVHTSIYPGKAIGPNSWTDACSLIDKDVPPGHFWRRDGRLIEIRF